MTRARVLLIVAAVLVCGAVIASMQPVRVLTIRTPRTSDASGPVPVAPVTGKSDVRLYYFHSVEHTPVEGRFAVDDRKGLVAVQTRFTSTGTGLPNTAVSRMHREGAWYVVDEQRRPVEPLRFYLLHAVNRTRITVDGSDVDLSSYRSGTLLEIGTARMDRWRWWLWRLTGSRWAAEPEK